MISSYNIKNIDILYESQFLLDLLEENKISDSIKEKFSKLKDIIKSKTSLVDKDIKEKKKYLKKHNIDVGFLESYANKKSREVLFKVKKDDITLVKLIKIIFNTFNDLLSLIPDALPKKLIISLILVMFAVYFNSFIFNYIRTITSSDEIALWISAFLSAPISEEMGKIISINQGAGKTYFIMFNIKRFFY